MWKLKVDNELYDCEVPKDPTLLMKEEKNPDGSYKIVSRYWEPLKVKFTDKNFFGFADGKDVELIFSENSKSEIWTLKKAEIDGNKIKFSDATYKIKKGK